MPPKLIKKLKVAPKPRGKIAKVFEIDNIKTMEPFILLRWVMLNKTTQTTKKPLTMKSASKWIKDKIIGSNIVLDKEDVASFKTFKASGHVPTVMEHMVTDIKKSAVFKSGRSLLSTISTTTGLTVDFKADVISREQFDEARQKVGEIEEIGIVTDKPTKKEIRQIDRIFNEAGKEFATVRAVGRRHVIGKIKAILKSLKGVVLSGEEIKEMISDINKLPAEQLIKTYGIVLFAKNAGDKIKDPRALILEAGKDPEKLVSEMVSELPPQDVQKALAEVKPEINKVVNEAVSASERLQSGTTLGFLPKDKPEDEEPEDFNLVQMPERELPLQGGDVGVPKGLFDIGGMAGSAMSKIIDQIELPLFNNPSNWRLMPESVRSFPVHDNIENSTLSWDNRNPLLNVMHRHAQAKLDSWSRKPLHGRSLDPASIIGKL
jgi:hypothetical protein